MSDLELEPVGQVGTEECLSVINRAFGRNESPEWYAWKHLEGPWGPSIGAAARDAREIVGVRLLLPWMLKVRGSEVLAYRATEAATVPEAQGRGVFSALNRWMMSEVPDKVIFSTPNRFSRGGYLKLGWQELGVIPHLWERARRRGKATQAGTVEAHEPVTAWSADALNWRSDPRCRHDYASVSHGGTRLHYRVLQRYGLSGVAPLGWTGQPSDLSGLWREMIGQTGAHFVLRPATQPSPLPSRLAFRRGENLLLGWVPPSSEVKLADLRSARWTHADLEAVI